MSEVCASHSRLPFVVYVGTKPACVNSLRAATGQSSDMVKWTHYGPFSWLALPLTRCSMHKWQLIITVHDSDVWIIRLEWLNMERHYIFKGERFYLANSISSICPSSYFFFFVFFSWNAQNNNPLQDFGNVSIIDAKVFLGLEISQL